MIRGLSYKDIYYLSSPFEEVEWGVGSGESEYARSHVPKDPLARQKNLSWFLAVFIFQFLSTCETTPPTRYREKIYIPLKGGIYINFLSRFSRGVGRPRENEKSRFLAVSRGFHFQAKNAHHFRPQTALVRCSKSVDRLVECGL